MRPGSPRGEKRPGSPRPGSPRPGSPRPGSPKSTKGQNELLSNNEEQAATKIQAVYRGNHVRHERLKGYIHREEGDGSPGSPRNAGKGPTGYAARPHIGEGALASVDAQGWSTANWGEEEYAKLPIEELRFLCTQRRLSTAGSFEQLIRRLMGYDCLFQLTLEELQFACRDRGLSKAGDHEALVLRLLEHLGKLKKNELQRLCQDRNLRIEGESGELLFRFLRSVRTQHAGKKEVPGQTGEERAAAARNRAEEKEKAPVPTDDFGAQQAVLHLREKKEMPMIHYPKLKSLDHTLKKLEEDKERWDAKFGRAEHNLSFIARLLAEFKHDHSEVGWSQAARHAREMWWAMHKFLQVHAKLLAAPIPDDRIRQRAERLKRMKALKDVGFAGEHASGLEGLFDLYTSLKSGGKNLMRKPDWARFLHDFHEAHPKVKGFKDVDHLLKIWDEYIELQKDMCVTYSMEKYEAAKGLCFDCFQAALHSTVPASFYHGDY